MSIGYGQATNHSNICKIKRLIQTKHFAYLTFATVLLLSSFTCRSQLADSLSLDTMSAFTDLTEAMKNPDKVIKLVLRKQKLKQFPSEILKFNHLQYLDLSKNHLKELPAGIDSLQALQVLLLSKNNLEILPKEIGKLRNLKVLNINQNDLVALPPQIGDLKDLEYLDLWSNNISVFPDQMSHLKNLRLMDLRVVAIEDEVQEHIKSLLPNTTIQFSQGCRCKTE
jgi:Leucine-rich repeat (LRR) protein